VNRLGGATSPYLLQHAENPVDWWPWGEEAFAEARSRDVPVLISVGYAACHWCHVMAHESFEHDGIAELVNANFVAVKVDREERPDVDAVYMAATQAMTGQGGWPMTVFATPDGAPFLCGTYFPRDNFAKLLVAVAGAWKDQREAVVRQGAAVVEAITPGALAVGVPVDGGVLDRAAASLVAQHDDEFGGFGTGGPKFPPHLAMHFMLRHYQRTGDEAVLEAVRHTAEAMARGGIYDQVGGGFHRYAVDAHWTVPHFEKMLYDNALLLRVYTQLWRLTGDALAGRIAGETFGFLVDGMSTPEGGFFSSWDADTAGVEGTTYVWTPDQLIDVLGPQDGAFAADLFEVTPEGSFEHGSSVLRLARDVDDLAPEIRDRWRSIRQRLAAARDERPQPEIDGKVIASWSAMAITAMCEYIQVEGAMDADHGLKPEELVAPVRAAALLANVHIVGTEDGVALRRVSLGGVVGEPGGVLDDYGCLAEAFCAVHQLTGDPRWLSYAELLLEIVLNRFPDGEGGFFDTPDDAPALITRPADPTDNATPSGLASAAAALTAYAALTGSSAHREAAEAALARVSPLIERHPRFAGAAAAVAEAHLSGPVEIAIVTDDPAHDLVAVATRHAPPGAVIVVGEPDKPGIALLADRPMIDGVATAYVCRGFVCDRPVTTAVELLTVLTR
jgi:uncharacterized protein YyaL (SSP411 family)